jgi:hypothetical protein
MVGVVRIYNERMKDYRINDKCQIVEYGTKEMKETKEKVGKAKEEEKEEAIVVTVRCIDMTASCVDIDIAKCTECGEETWLSTSWREKKIDKIVCKHCFDKNYMDGDYSANITEECLNQVIKFVRERCSTTRPEKEIRKELIDMMQEKLGKQINIIEDYNKKGG